MRRADDDRRLGPLAGEQHRIALAGPLEGEFDCGLPVGFPIELVTETRTLQRRGF